MARRKTYRGFRGRGKYTGAPEQGTAKQYYKKKYSAKSKRKVAKKSSGWKGLGRMVGSLAPMVGTALGSVLPGGALVGSGIGNAVSGLANSIFGSGDYDVRTNSILGAGPDVPIMHPGKNMSSIRVRHREYIADIVSDATPNTYSNVVYPINPANPRCFPWLCSMAQLYQEWRPLGIVFEYKSTSADVSNGTAIALGSVILSTNYNSNLPVFTSKQQQENTEYAISGKPSMNIMHAIECDPSMMVLNQLYIDRPNSSVTDLRFQNLGLFQISTAGFQGSSQVCGELWVTYDIELVFPTGINLGKQLSDHYQFSTGVSGTQYFGTAIAANQMVPTTSSNMGTSLTATTIVFPKESNYSVEITYRVLGDSGAWVPPTLVGTNGADDINLVQGDTVDSTNNATLTGVVMSNSYFFNIVGLGDGTHPTITFTAGTIITTSSSGDLYITTHTLTN